MKLFTFAAVTLLVVSGIAGAQQKSGDEAALLAIEAKWDEASVKGDTATLDSLWADTFISTSPEGKVRTKPEMLARLKSGAIKYQLAKVEDLKVSVYGDAAVVTGSWKGKFVADGKTEEATERFTDTFVRLNGQWRCVASHASPIK